MNRCARFKQHLVVCLFFAVDEFTLSAFISSSSRKPGGTLRGRTVLGSSSAQQGPHHGLRGQLDVVEQPRRIMQHGLRKVCHVGIAATIIGTLCSSSA